MTLKTRARRRGTFALSKKRGTSPAISDNAREKDLPKGAEAVIKNALASVAVKDLPAATRWYERLLGERPDSRPMEDVAEWGFARGGWLQVYQLPERAGNCSCTLSVTDLDGEIARLRATGIAVGEPTVGPRVRVVMIEDPDGNSIALSEALDASMAQ